MQMSTLILIWHHCLFMWFNYSEFLKRRGHTNSVTSLGIQTLIQVIMFVFEGFFSFTQELGKNVQENPHRASFGINWTQEGASLCFHGC